MKINPNRRHKLHRSQHVIYRLNKADREDPGLRKLPDYLDQFYPKMLINDVGMTMVPISNAHVGFDPADEVTEQIVAMAISLRDYSSDLSWAAHQFFEMCAQRVMTYGEDVYAIVYLSEAEGEEPVGFDLMPIHPATVTRDREKLAQYVPKSQRREMNAPEYIELPADRTVVFQAPEHLRDRVAQTLDALASMGTSIPPEWAMEELGKPRRRVPFDTNAYARAHQLAVAEACKDLGWDARGLINKNMLEYYRLHRRLRFERFRVELREHLLGTLNEGLARAGEKVGFAGRLTIEGVPSLSDVEAAEAHLAAGDAPFNDLMEPLMGY